MRRLGAKGNHMSSLNNREYPPRGRAGGASECNVCLRPPIKPEDDLSVEFVQHPRTVICITCLKAANEAIKSPQPMA